MKWLRLYHDLPHDPKLRRIAHQAGATLPQTIAVWVCMLCHASENDGEARGTLRGWDDDDCAFALGMDRAIVYAIRCEMQGRTLDGDTLIAWSKRQYESDNNAARMRRWREKKSEQNQPPDPPVTSPKRHGDVTVTTKNRTEQKREEKTYSSSSSEGGVGGAAPRNARRLPTDWWPTAADQEHARSLGLDPTAVADSFRDYWHGRAGAGAAKLDWSATWRNWCRKDAERKPKPRQPESKTAWALNHPMFNGGRHAEPDRDSGAVAPFPAPARLRSV